MKNIWILALLGLIASCNSIETNDLEKQSVENDDYIVFGRFYGYCLGEKCIDIYKFTDQKILEDSRDQYPNYIESYPGSFDQDLTENWYKYAEIHLPEVPVACTTYRRNFHKQFLRLEIKKPNDYSSGFCLIKALPTPLHSRPT
jgi:hypothetical protein